MPDCIRCREELAEPEANYCGKCGFPIVDAQDEDEFREWASRENDGFLEGDDYSTILDHLNGEQPDPMEQYQWYLEEAVMKAFGDIAALQKWEWFDKEPVAQHFFSRSLLAEQASDEDLEDFMIFARIMAFFYEVLDPAGLELGIKLGGVVANEVDSYDDIDVSISVEPGANAGPEASGPAS